MGTVQQKPPSKLQPTDRGNAHPSPTGCLSLAAATLTVATVCLVQYMALDYFVVRLRPYPAEANDYDWAILLFPVIPALLLLGLSATRILPLGLSPGIASLLLGLLLAIPLIATVGNWFHFAIGGTL